MNGVVAKNNPKGKENKPGKKDTKNPAHLGLSAWTWGLIGAGVGLVGLLVVRLISGMIGG